MDAELAARRWRKTWLRGWPAEDADAIAALYAEDAIFRSHPFRAPHGALEYARWAFGDQDAAACWFGEPVVDGDRATVEYWGIVTSGERDETIAGVSVLRFGADGLVAEQRDYWTSRAGRHEPPEGWGR